MTHKGWMLLLMGSSYSEVEGWATTSLATTWPEIRNFGTYDFLSNWNSDSSIIFGLWSLKMILILHFRGSMGSIHKLKKSDSWFLDLHHFLAVFLAFYPLLRRTRCERQSRKLIWQQIWEAFPATLEILQREIPLQELSTALLPFRLPPLIKPKSFPSFLVFARVRTRKSERGDGRNG